MRAIIFANGIMEKWPENLILSEGEDLIIAADGGLGHCRHWQLAPNIVVGDMDSADPNDLAALDSRATKIIRHPRHKDETDLDLAIRLAMDHDTDEIIILGSLGARWDMTFSNLLLMAADAYRNASLCILDGAHEMRCIRGNAKITLTGSPGDLVSLMPLAGDAIGVTLTGLAYPLDNARLPMGCSRGISNRFIDKTATVSVASGTLLIVMIRNR